MMHLPLFASGLSFVGKLFFWVEGSLEREFNLIRESEGLRRKG
jgi:hypothetical protein